MCHPVYGMVHIKEPLLLLRKSSPCGGIGFSLSLSEWSFTIMCLSVFLNKTFLPAKLQFRTFLYRAGVVFLF